MNYQSCVVKLFPSGSEFYWKDFKALVQIVYSVHNRQAIYPRDTYQLALYKRLKSVPIRNLQSIEVEDIEQQLLCIWWEILSRRKTNKQSLRAYLLRLSVFELTVWYQQQVRVPDGDESLGQTVQMDSLSKLPWLIERKEDVSPYYAYLLFLYFVQGLTIVEMTKVLQREKRTVRTLLHQALEQLKEYR